MNAPEVQTLVIGNSDPRVVEAVELLLAEVVHKDEPVKRGESRDFIGTVSRLDHTLYGIFNPEGVAIAAAEVGHNDAGSTAVWRIAVAETQRSEGFGTALMRHIASEAVDAGDQSVWVPTLKSGFLEKLGFAKLGEDSMAVSAAELAQA